MISSTEVCQPVLYHLASKRASVSLFYAAAPEAAITKQVVSFCNGYHIPIVLETTKEHIYEWIRNDQPDIVFITGYGLLLNVNGLGSLKYGVFNVHFGSLPNYRGPSPVFWQLKNGEKTIDVCIHKLTSKADAGPVVWRKSIANEEHHNYTFINQYLSNVLVEGVDFILNCLPGGKLMEFPQDETKAKYYSRPLLKDVMINWHTMQAAAIFNLCKACNSWNWGAITSYKGAELKILDATISTGQQNKEPGTIISVEKNLVVACLDGSCSINFMNLNGIFFPGRYAGNFGIAVDHRLGG
ncbi:methionyl-tRNA formyltransferase [Niastella caeni]|uniref:methionyl-tRNA formyltransferase n=1 Tax=Niastella caeni TaxID=2569763 RepID=UPI00140B6B4F|nr:formyltransferase family protein [Niastella caeni]